MTKYDQEIYDNYTPSENVQKRLNKIDINPDTMPYQEILAILEFEGAFDEDSALTMNEIIQIAEKIEGDISAKNIPTKRTVNNRLEKLVKKEIVVKEEEPSPYEFWKKGDDKIDPYYYWYLEESIRKIDPYIKPIVYPHTISSLGVVIYIMITLPSFLVSEDVILLLLLIGFYLVGHLASYFDVMKIE